MPADFPDYAQASNPPFPITSIAKASSPQTVNIPLPTGTIAISLTVSSALALQVLTVNGHVTGADYTESLQPSIWFNYPTQWLLIDPVDTSVDIIVQFAADTDFLYVGGSFAPVAVGLNPNEDVLAQLVDSAGTNLGSFTFTPGGLTDSDQVLAAGLPKPIAWMRPAAPYSATRTTNGTTALVTPNVNLTTWMWSWSMTQFGSTGGCLAYIQRHSDGMNLVSFAGTGSISANGSLDGVLVGAGDGIDFVAASIGASGTMVCSITATQQVP